MPQRRGLRYPSKAALLAAASVHEPMADVRTPQIQAAGAGGGTEKCTAEEDEALPLAIVTQGDLELDP